MLRIISKAKWSSSPDWLPSDQVPADTLNDLRTADNKLSVWLLPEESQLERLIAALVAARDKMAKFDYALLDEAELGRLDIQMVQAGEPVPDSDVSQWHHHLFELTAQRLAALALSIWERGRKVRILPADLGNLLASAVNSGRIDATQLSPNIITYLEDRGLLSPSSS